MAFGPVVLILLIDKMVGINFETFEGHRTLFAALCCIEESPVVSG